MEGVMEGVMEASNGGRQWRGVMEGGNEGV